MGQKIFFFLSLISLTSCATRVPRPSSNHQARLPEARSESETKADVKVESDEENELTLEVAKENDIEEKAQVSDEERDYLEHVGAQTAAEGLTIKDFNLHYFPQMYQYWISYLTGKGKERFIRHMNNGKKYFPVVKAVMQKYGLPEELFFVGLIESGYHLGAKSSASAVGPWQFMKGTATRYGLKVGRKDERRDIIKATQAAASYFRDLYNIFGSWELALCAYNAGEYGIIRAIRKGNTRDYIELVKRKLLPKETMYYIPKIAAAKELVLNYEKYDLPHLAIKLDGPSSTKAKALVSKSQGPVPLYASRSSRSSRSSRVSRSAKVKAQASSRPQRRVSSRSHHKLMLHVVRKGEGLYAIARRYGVSWVDIKKLNKLKSKRLFVGQKLRLPIGLKRYVVRRGDNLNTIAQKFGTSIVKIVEHNRLKSHTIYPRQEIIVPTSYDM